MEEVPSSTSTEDTQHTRDVTFEDNPDDGPKDEQKEFHFKEKVSLKRSSTMDMSTQQKETVKAKLQKIKQARAERASRIPPVARAAMEMVAFYLKEEFSFVEEGVLDFEQHIIILDNFFSPGGPKSIIFNCTERKIPPQESGRFFSSSRSDSLVKRVVVSDCTDIDLTGTSVLVYRITENRKNPEDLQYAVFHVNEENPSLVSYMHHIHNLVIAPQLACTTAWGNMTKTLDGPSSKKRFLDDFKGYVHFLKMTKEDLEGAVKFESNKALYDKLKEPAKLMALATDIDILNCVETIVRSWIKKMEWVLTQSDQLRSEKPDVAPEAELEHWRMLLTKFASIREHTRSPECIAYLTYLVQAHSKVIKKWRFFDNWVTFSENEASENVRYLYALLQYLEPLHSMSPEEMPSHLPSLLYSIRMTYAMSRFFNTTERITTLLVKVTNQMLNACMIYLTENNTKTVWQQKKSEMINKMFVCTKLYKTYRDAYFLTKFKIEEDEDETNLEASEMYVFGKFKTFKTRLSKLRNVLKTTLKYSILENSKLAGIEVHAAKFKSIYLTISSKTYNVLNHRKPDFDIDYDIFKSSIAAAETELRIFKEETLAEAPDVVNRLLLIKRFKKLNLPSLDLEKSYKDAVQLFYKELCEIYDYYFENINSPPIPRLYPPVTGTIAWLRQLGNRIEEIMTDFEGEISVLEPEIGSKLINMYEYLQTELTYQEEIYYRGWFEQVKRVQSCLSVPLLGMTMKPGVYKLNYHNYITELIRETENFLRIDKVAPELALLVIVCKPKIFFAYEGVKALMQHNTEIRKNIPQIFVNLIRSQLAKLDTAFLPLLGNITWTSLTIPQILDSIKSTLDKVDMFCKEATDMKEARVDETLDALGDQMLIYIPQQAMDGKEWHKKNQDYCQIVSKELQIKSLSAEEAVIELINKFVEAVEDISIDPQEKYNWLDINKLGKPIFAIKPHGAGSEEDLSKKDIVYTLDDLKADCMEVYGYFNRKNVDALTKSTRNTLRALRERSSASSVVCRYEHDKNDPNYVYPLFVGDMILYIPNVMIQPTLDEMQMYFTKIARSFIGTIRAVPQWGINMMTDSKTNANVSPSKVNKRGKSIVFELVSAIETGSHDLDNRKDYLKQVIENKEIARLTVDLQGLIVFIKSDVSKELKNYQNFTHLWSDERNEKIHAFVDLAPVPIDIEDKFLELDKYLVEVEEIPPLIIIGPLEIHTSKFKLALKVEWNEWKLILGNALLNAYRKKLESLWEFIETKGEILQKPVKDLDDIRTAMACLESVRDNFINMDKELIAIEEAYAIFAKFHLKIPPEDIDKVDGLRFNFNNLIRYCKETQETLCKVQEPMKKELMDGVAKFDMKVSEFDKDFEENGPMVEGLEAREASDRVLLFQGQFDNLWKDYEIFSSGEKLFGMPVNEYPVLVERKKQFNLLQKLYSLYLVVNKAIDGYFKLSWQDVDIELITAELIDFQNRCRKLPKGMKDWPAFIELKKKIDDFNECCPLLELMANKSMKDRHWKRLEKLLGTSFEVDNDEFTLKNVMDAPLLKYKDDVEDICLSASKEKDIESKLKQIIADWTNINLSFGHYKTRGEILLKGAETQEINAQIEESLMAMNSLAANRYNTPFKKEITTWVMKLGNTGEILEKWLMVQNLWMYLEAVFVGGDIAKELPGEAKRFASIDKSWSKIMARARMIQNVIETCTGDESMGQLLPHLQEQLETCQKSLTGYLEQKMLIFPRFFFISDTTLLEILGKASDSHKIQDQLGFVFDNLQSVEFDEKEYDKIVAILSGEKERVPLEKEVMCYGGVEVWLGNLLTQSRNTIATIIVNVWQYFSEPDFTVLDMIAKFPAQIGLLGIQLLWTRDSEFALVNWKYDKFLIRKTNERFLLMLNELIDQTTRDLSRNDRTKYETLVLIHVHQRDIFDDLYKLKIRSKDDFEWLKQERFYFDEETEVCTVQITDVDFIYQNEFLGCTERLVITPLTDRCYITLAQAIGMNMGGAPAGPAGTGKTESTKDLGKSLGKFVVVFNCSDQQDIKALGKIYKGLANSGSWGCFDEFNRIELPVLSVAAQQISTVLTARKERKTSFVFSDGSTISLNPEVGIFITMNPGYAGRQELPENLKILFRSVAMMVPDRQIIMRVKLASCGFKDNIVLARKFFVLYKLCEEQLSKQRHYDFGLRNILSVLRTLGAQKRAHPNDTEESTVMRVLKDMNVSKLVDEDEPLFQSLIDDLFVGLKLTTSTYKELQRGIASTCEEKVLVNHPPWNLKVVQLYETSLVRHGLMTLGPTGCGKTKCIEVLMAALTECGQPHKEMRMNPKAITAPQMFGRLDAATNDWTDGIFSTLWRRAYKIKKGEHVWIVLDGPVDAVWIENLNSVLDDNKTLTLANGDRIVMAPNSKLVFEPDNVDKASPATVSRMGMVYISASVLSWEPCLDGWLKTRTQRERDILKPLFLKIYADLHTFVQTKLMAKMKIFEALYIRQCTDLLKGLMDVGDEHRNYTEAHLERLFLFSLMWSLGSVLELDDRAKMEEFVRSHPSKLKWPKPTEGETIFEYVVGDNGDWQHWSERVEEYKYPSDSVPEYASILVPNVDNVRTAFLIDTIAKQFKPVLLIGEQGTAKTVMLKSYMANYDPEIQLSKCMNFSSETTPNMFQRNIESYVEKRVGSTYGPPNNRKMTVFIDDINMPIVNEWGDQVTNEIVRQLIDMVGFYSLDKPGEFLTIKDIQIMGTMIHPGGGRNDIPHRLKRQFCIFNCTLPSDKSMDKIFSVMGEGYFCLTRFSEKIVQFLPKLVPLTRMVWQQTKVKMLPTPAKFHYVFNLRDLSRIWEGILKIQDAECPTPTNLMKLWRHECYRVIADRFTNENDTKWFRTNLANTATSYLGEDSIYFDDEDTYFVDFLREIPEPTGDEPDDFVFEAPKIYEEIPSWEFLKEKLHMFMAGYNEVIRGSPMDLVFFRDAMVHLMKISRIIRTPRGNAILVGVGGSGKQSLTRLASFIANYQTHQIVLTRSYNVGNFQEDLKLLFRVSGLQGKGITFLFTDNDIKEESFLEYLNNVLSAGEVANLFAKDEMDEITNELVPVMKKRQPKRPPTRDNLYDFFIQSARNNLHVVLCFSPVGEKFRSRSLKFPGLISGCTMDWFSRWPKDALVAVSTHFLLNFPINNTPTVKESLIVTMAEVQDMVSDVCIQYYNRFRRQSYVTPKSFLFFLDGYKVLYNQRQAEIKKMAQQMIVGLEKLVEASESVDVLRVDLVEKEKEVAVESAKAEEILAAVAKDKAAAEVIKTEVMEKTNEATAIANEVEAENKIAQKALDAATPALNEAKAALDTIKGSDIATVRKLGKPPYLVTVIMDVVLILFQRRLDQVRPDLEKNFITMSWAESLKVMADTRFLFNLQRFPKDNINAETIDLMLPYLENPVYTYDNAKTACGNVAGLLQWTRSMRDFFEVNKDVLPLKANLARLNVKMNKAKKEQEEQQVLLRAKEEEVAAAEAKLQIALDKKKEVEDKANKVKYKMEAASALINGLSGEKIRWTEQSQAFKSETERLVGDVLLLVGFLSYTGPFNQEFRTLLQSMWYNELINHKIPVTTNLNIIENLVDTPTIGEWNLQGLPTDELSIQNGIIVTKASRFPLLIDPQSQGVAWIKKKEKENDLQVTTLNHKFFRTHIEDGVSLGRPVLIEDCLEELDPCLDNVLEKNFIKIGTSLKVKVGDKEVDVNKNFRLYMTTKLANPAYSPEIFARTNIIDFTVTIKGLEDQLLGRVILTEKKELEVERISLIKDVTDNKRLMKELETNLLHKLTTVKGSLLDDESVITVLNTTQTTAASVRDKLKIAAATEAKINTAREEYRPIATRGSVLYFLIVDMSLVNCMYQTSLVQFLERFDLSMQRSEKSLVAHKRIGYVIDYLTYEVFCYQCRGLYENHKYMFTLLLTLKVDLQRKAITHDEFQNFVKGGSALDLSSAPPKPCKWMTDSMWLNLVQLSTLPHFKFILTQVPASEKQWKAWFDKAAPEEEHMPDGYEALDPFRRLLMVRAWCEDRTLAQSKKYVSYSMDSRYTEPVIFNIDVLLNESRPNTPMVCFLSMGSDPTPTIETAAKRREIECRAISMGQGQEVPAKKLISNCLVQGGWVLLQNCHLAIKYMSDLFITLSEAETMHNDFRLWITTEKHDKFPINLLQISLKYTNDPPQGIRAGLMRTYKGMNQDLLDYSGAPQYLPLLFSISFMHTVLQERRKFKALGWNIPYEFNFADWYASVMFIQKHLDDMDPKIGISWVTLRYMLAEVQYGGRVTDDYDKRLLNTFTKVWFSEEMFSDAFRFYTGYKIMSFKNLTEYHEGIEDMSPIDPPQAYGLHTNADITYQSNTTRELLDTVLSIQPKESSGDTGGESRESVVSKAAQDMLDKLPKNYDPYLVKERLIKMGITSSLNIFLKQEIDRMQKVITLVRTTLKDLLLAIEGTIIMNEACKNALDCIYDAKVPDSWKEPSWESSTLGFWMTELQDRNTQFSNWIFVKRPPQFWMTGFFNPQGFLTAMRQEVARAHKGWALDAVTLDNTVTKFTREEIRQPPPEGVYVYGLYLDGAGWDRKNSRLTESVPKVVSVLMPVVHISAINSTAPKDPKLYQCPVYKKPKRTDLTFITPLWLQCKFTPEHWILRGVALLCDTK